MQTQRIKLADLAPNKGQIPGLPSNPRQWTRTEVDKIAKSLKETPELFEARPIIVTPYGGKYIILGGNLRYEGCKANKDKDAPCIIIPEGTTVEKMKEIVVKDNGAFGSWDFDALANEWDDLPLVDWGVPAWETEDKPGTPEVKEDNFDEDADGILVRCNPGDIWQLGDHRLMCGDSTDLETVKKLTGGGEIDLVLTDPPYGMNAVSKSGVLSKRYDSDIMGDDDNETAKKAFFTITQMFPNARHIWFGANYYTEVLPSSECWIVWDKNNGASDQTDCELAWTNFRSVVRQFTMASEKTSRVHPTQKPVRLISEILNRFEKNNRYQNILDVFGGSGTTIIAAEQLKRRCYMMELDPHYCDVIIARWETLTGKVAQLITPGEKGPQT